MTCAEIVAKGKEMCSKIDLGDYKKYFIVEVALKGEHLEVFYIETNEGKVNIELGENKKRHLRVTATYDNFVALAKRELDPKKALLTGKLKVEGGIDKAFEFKKVLGLMLESYKKALATV